MITITKRNMIGFLVKSKVDIYLQYFYVKIMETKLNETVSLNNLIQKYNLFYNYT